jgi:hypothetical protein
MGGNVFKTPEKEPLTQRIPTKAVHPTIQFIEKITGLTFDEEDWLGTTGKKNDPDGAFEKNSSGDLDLNTDANKVSKEQLIAKLSAWLTSQGIPDDQIMNMSKKDMIAKTGDKSALPFTGGYIHDAGDQVHFRTPIQGGEGYVQTDFMFTLDPAYQRGAKRGGTVAYSGRERAVLLSSIARARGYKFSPKFGLQDPETGDMVSNDWDEIAKLLLGKTAREVDTHTVESIIAVLKKDPDYEKLVAKAREDFAKGGKVLPESVETLADKNYQRIVELLSKMDDR